MLKAFCYHNFCRGAPPPPTPWGIIRQKYPGQIGLRIPLPYVKVIENKQSWKITSAKKKWRMTNQKFISNTVLWRKYFWKFIQDIFAWTFPLLCLYWLLVMDFCILGLRLRFLFIGLHMFKFFKHHCYWMLVFLSWLACEAVEAI